MVTTTLRINYVLYQQVEEQAEKEDRSVNKEIQYIIKRYLEMIHWNNRK